MNLLNELMAVRKKNQQLTIPHVPPLYQGKGWTKDNSKLKSRILKKPTKQTNQNKPKTTKKLPQPNEKLPTLSSEGLKSLYYVSI